MDKTYKFLGISAIIFKIAAVLLPAILLVMAIIIFIGGGTPEAPRLTGLVSLVLGLVYFFIFFTASEVIQLLLEIRSKLNNKGSSE